MGLRRNWKDMGRIGEGKDNGINIMLIYEIFKVN